MTSFKLAALGVASLFFSLAHAQPMSPALTPALKAALAPTGELRAVINTGNAVLAGLDAQQQAKGVSVDIARELAKRTGLPLKLVVVNAAAGSVSALAKQDVDIGFVAIDPLRGKDLAYTAAYVTIEGAYLVRNNSPLKSNDEVDRAGTRIVVGKGSAYDLYLSREIKHATLAYAPTSQAVVEVFLSQNLEVAAGVRQQLEKDMARLGGLRLLPGRFMAIHQAMATPKTRSPEVVAYLHGFVEELKASGFVAEALQRHRIDGVAVAERQAQPSQP